MDADALPTQITSTKRKGLHKKRGRMAEVPPLSDPAVLPAGVPAASMRSARADSAMLDTDDGAPVASPPAPSPGAEGAVAASGEAYEEVFGEAFPSEEYYTEVPVPARRKRVPGPPKPKIVRLYQGWNMLLPQLYGPLLDRSGTSICSLCPHPHRSKVICVSADSA